ncbi:Rnf-Nqr domain containing protein [Desulfoluna spongiiphila]|nr:Rnf-Nqr domain containing protein [Desulfoluna spongiiphila]
MGARCLNLSHREHRMNVMGHLFRHFFYDLWIDPPGWVVFFSIFWLVSVFSVSTGVVPALFLGGGTTLILLAANAFFSWASASSYFQKEAPPSLRYVLPVLRGILYLLCASMLVPFLELFLRLLAPQAYPYLQALSPYIPIGCLILSRFGGFPRHHAVKTSLADGALTGMGFTVYLLFIGLVTQFLSDHGKSPFYGAVLGGGLLGLIAYAVRENKKKRDEP